jgi:hypothetical protein
VAAMSDDPLSTILKRQAPGPPSLAPSAALPPDGPEPDALTIAQMDGDYAGMRPATRNLTRLHVVLKDGKVRSFQYHFLDVESTFDGGAFILLFAGTKHWQITVKGHGPKFWAIYDSCTLHRWPYLREATMSMPGADGETVLTEIKIQDVTPRERE